MKYFEDKAWIFLGICVVLFAMTIVFGKNIHGAKNWIQIGSHSFQPSEITKISFIFLLASYYKNEKKYEQIQLKKIPIGKNDAPALKTAAVGVAMGGLGSDIAVGVADIVLMRDDISRLPYLKRLSDATLRTIRASIALSMGINLFAVTLSVLGVLTPTTGALVHNAGSCFVVLIAALLYDRKFE